MGLIGEALAKQIKKFDKNASLQDNAKSYHGIGVDPSSVKDIKKLIEGGIDPLHAAYVSMQNLTSIFAELVSGLPELKAYCDIVGPAEEEYMPSGPPMSPLTGSYFTCWAFFDFRFGPDKETIGTCLLDVTNQLDFSLDMGEILELMQNSRMGIYEHLGIQGGKVLLQEIMTQEQYLCYVPAGYWGEKMQCWMVRLLPPINDLFDYSIVFNTPYVLTRETRDNWTTFIKRTILGADNETESYHEFMKYGLDTHYWNEYIFQAYHHHQHDAIFLAGLPDVQESLPHANLRTAMSSKPARRVRNRNLKVKKRKRRR